MMFRYGFLSPVVAALLSLHVAFHADVATATLGEKADSVETSRSSYAMTKHKAKTAANYTVHENANDGLTIREYEDTNGTIFAVAWSGVNHPDLTALLGSYFADFSTANQSAVRSHIRMPRSEVHGSKVVVIRSGHMRAVSGRAFIPTLLPAGVSADELN